MELVARIPELSFAEAGKFACISPDGKSCLREQRFIGLERYTGTANLQRIGGLVVSRTCLPLPTCRACRIVVEEVIEKKRKEIWDAIPSYFGFPDGGWDACKTKLDEIYAS